VNWRERNLASESGGVAAGLAMMNGMTPRFVPCRWREGGWRQGLGVVVLQAGRLDVLGLHPTSGNQA